MGWQAGMLGEDPDEMVGTQAGDTGQMADGDILVEIGIKIVDGPPDSVMLTARRL